MSRAWFVTGTDTGVGKTAVTAALLRAGSARGLSTIGLKPVESGCVGPLGEDGRALQSASSVALADEEVCAYCLQAPLAPTVAAAREGRTIEWERIEAVVDSARRRGPDLLLVEGAGGLLVPMTEELDMAGAAQRLGLGLVIVARDSLGTINHTCLTVEVARSRGLGIVGVVLNGAAGATSLEDVRENARQIERLSGARVLGHVACAAGDVSVAGLELSRLL